MKWAKLGDVCEILDKHRKPIAQKLRIKGEYPYYGANGIVDYVNDYIFNGTYLLMGEDGSVINKDGSPVLNWVEKQKIWVNNHAHVLAEKSDICLLRFLFYYLSVIDISKSVRGMPPKLNQEFLKAIQIPIPPMDEQARIVGVLDRLEAVSGRLISVLERELSLRIKQYNYYSDEILNPKRLSQINGAKLMPLSEFAIFKDGTHQTPKYQESGVSFISVENIKNIYESQKFISQEDFDKYKFKPQIGDIFMTRIGVIGECAIMERSMDLAYYVTLALIRTNKELVNPRFLRHCIESAWGKSELYKYTLHNAYPKKINLGEIGRLKFVIPLLDEQSRIVKILDNYANLKDALVSKISAEIKERTKQARFYKEQLLSFDKS